MGVRPCIATARTRRLAWRWLRPVALTTTCDHRIACAEHFVAPLCPHMCHIGRAAMLELAQDLQHCRVNIVPARHERSIELHGKCSHELRVEHGSICNV